MSAKKENQICLVKFDTLRYRKNLKWNNHVAHFLYFVLIETSPVSASEKIYPFKLAGD